LASQTHLQALGLDITNCDLQFCSSFDESRIMTSSGKRSALRFTAWLSAADACFSR
jgi:hypothetical protein